MLRIALCLMFALMSSAAVAREVKLSSPNGGGCPDEETSSHPDEPTTSEAPSREAVVGGILGDTRRQCCGLRR